ncbi:PLD nuclease N-terminal domain-containing protein [Streptomyces yunnanensis]|uniref:PLD nuclease N-terminal domain-containing protein n=1 Tax=Streptomyces yunnanensis TaxID=156453 RepID=A0ABY8A2K7_9ACTN|nr:PLD nuclease N-terminal domain-containing protein [Streptomyces yunnanensis]WEB39190.1 PLD nuclease N-terminal domain-containing protein [Streptomyces yunnanensis]
MQAQLAHQMAIAPTGNIMIACAMGAAALGLLALYFGALLGIVRSDLTSGMKLVWLAFALMAPFFGCLLWFLVGRRDAQRRAGIA